MEGQGRVTPHRRYDADLQSLEGGGKEKRGKGRLDCLRRKRTGLPLFGGGGEEGEGRIGQAALKIGTKKKESGIRVMSHRW